MKAIKITITIPESELSALGEYEDGIDGAKKELADDVGRLLKRSYIESFTIKVEEI